MHQPVLLKEVIEYLDPVPGSFVIDGTVNGGGHAREIIKKISPGGRFLGMDWDERLIGKLKEQSWITANRSSVTLVSENYAELPNVLNKEKLPKADGLLLDLGFSSEQLENSGRGFSFDKDEPLYMTYSSLSKPVAEIIRELKENELAEIIFKLGGERLARKIAKAVKEAGKKKRIISSLELANIIRAAVPKNYESGRIDPATRTFQALRIYANSELDNLKKVLSNLKQIIKTNGRIAIISFHSLEDGIIKKEFQRLEKAGELKILTKKPVEPSEAEIKSNPRSRSAKLRVGEII